MGSTARNSLENQDPLVVDPSKVLHVSDSLNYQQMDGYRIVERLGGGAMATVYRAIDASANREVALKVLAPGADDTLRERFRIEARTVSVLSHPHIVQTLQVGEVQNGFPYIAMELVEGDSLAALLERQNQLSVADSCLLLEPIARALSYAHSHHVIHRDVKPSNILLRYSQPGLPYTLQLSALDTPVIPLLSDFGIARALDAPELTTAGRTIGTPAYMSPEQCAGARNLDGRADIYSLATVLYRCLVGRPPFMGATTQILHAHVYEALTIPDAMAQALPPSILRILQRSLQKNPEDRYADMALFADDLAAMVRQVRAQRKGIEDSTITMPLVATLSAEQEKKTAHVLVSGITEQNTRQQFSGGRIDSPAVTGAGTGGAASVPHPLTAARTTQSAASIKNKAAISSPSRTKTRTQRSTRWFYLSVATLLSAALLLLTLTSLLNILSNLRTTNTVGGQPPAAVATQPGASISTPSQVSTESGAGVGVSTQATTSATDATAANRTPAPTWTGGLSETAGVAGTVAATVTATMTDTAVLTSALDYDLGKIWNEDVLFFYADHDWRQTRRRTLEVLSTALQEQTDITLTDVLRMSPPEQAELIVTQLLTDTTSAFWQVWQKEIPRAEVQQVLFDTYVGIANEENAAGRPAAALAYFDAALLVRADEQIARLNAATARYVNSFGETPQSLAAQALSDAYQSYAAQLAAAQSFCPAVEYLEVANAVVATTTFTDTVQSYREQCTSRPGNPQVVVLEPTPTTTPTLSVSSSVSFIYSTEENGQYRIYRTSTAGENPTSVLLVENGAQPGISADGRYMAFYSTRDDSKGISLFDFTAPLSSGAAFPRLSNFIEDAERSAPSWSPDSNRIAFSSGREGDRILRVYITSAPDRSNAFQLDFGEDPAWGPRVNGQALITYKGTDDTGNRPGLWLVTETKSKLGPLTTDGNDRRPVWSPDGQYVVFMRPVEDGNWDLFRVRVADGNIVRLTTYPAQDGLPTISPDGQWVAFVTDRSGNWEIWKVAIDGSNEQRVMPIQGVMRNWLEHAIQWVE